MGFDGLRIRRLGVRTLPAGIAPAVAGPALSEFLGADPTYQPFGAQLIHWDDDRHAFSEGWSRSDISSPNSASTASGETGLIYTVIVEDGTWRLAAIRLTDGSIAWTTPASPPYNSILMVAPRSGPCSELSASTNPDRAPSALTTLV